MTEIREVRDTAAAEPYARDMARGRRHQNGHRQSSIRTEDEYRAIWQKRYDQGIADGMSPSIASFCAKQQLRKVMRADAGAIERLDVVDYDFDAYAAWR